MSLSPGTRLGPYEIVASIGAGGMGEVYRARDTRLGRTVAVKVLLLDHAADAERKSRFLQEARAASALNHPHIVTVYDIASEGGMDFIVMEFVPGKPLSALIPRTGLALGEALKYAVQMAGALAAAHAAGIVHRDLKPANVIVGDSGSVKLLDFGVAKLVGGLEPGESESTRTMQTQEGTVLGTAAYMSPEQAEGKTVDARSDIFSFGVVLYEMLTGQRPFRGESSLSLLSSILRDEPAPPLGLVADLPAGVERMVLRCLRKDPAGRFQHTEDLKVALEELQEDTLSGALTAARPALAPARSRRAPAWTAIAALIMAGAGGAWWLTRSHKPTNEAAMTAVPLTSYAGHVMEPSFSPDGNQVAFAWDGEKQDNFDIYLKLVGPGAPLRLTTDPGHDYSPAWSPDGRSIAFLRLVRGGPGAVMLIPALGGPERKLAEGYFTEGLSWSGDGQWLIVARRVPPLQPHGLYALSIATGDLHPLTQPAAGAWAGDQQPALSPDGRTLAFARTMTRVNSAIWLQAVTPSMEAKEAPRQLTFEDRACSHPAWTADGREIVFSSGNADISTTAAVWRIPADAGPHTRAARVPLGEGGQSPALSRQGRLVFARASIDDNIWRLPLHNGKPAPAERLVFSTRRDAEPRYSPDGRKIVFTSDRAGSNEVWICDADGSNAFQLTSMNSTLAGGARWSPDGKRIVFVSSLEGQVELYLVGAGGGKPIRLTNNPAHDSAPSWSRDGKWIYFASNRSGRFEVWKMTPEANAAPVQVTRNGGFAALESTDGKTLYFTRLVTGAQNKVLRMPVGGGPETEVIPLMGAWGDFDVTSGGVYYLSSQGPGAEIHLLSLSGTDSILGRVERRAAFGLAARPDNSDVLYTQFDTESSELVLIDNFR